MTDADALLASILGHPEDDLPRLVYADWLEDGGDHERSEFIRVQCELAAMSLPCDCGRLDVCPTGRCITYLPDLRKRERELWAAVTGGTWFDGLSGFLLAYSVSGHSPEHSVAVVRRGFVESVRLPLAAFLGGECERCGGDGGRQGDGPDTFYHDCFACSGTGRAPGIAKRLFESQPVTTVTLSDREPVESVQHPGWFRWWSWADPDNAAVIGDDLYKMLRSDFSISEYQPYFSSRELALAAISDAAVAWGRSLANLRPLEPVA